MMHAGSRPGRRSRLGADLGLLAVIGTLLLAALAAGGLSLYQQFYSPSAFVRDYTDLLATGRAADALRIPGVSVDKTLLDDAGIDSSVSEALLRSTALAPLEDVHVVSEEDADGVHTVTIEYAAAGVTGRTAFEIVQDGWIGVVPNWRFAESPLAAVELTLRGADQFAVNGFGIDRRQISPDGVEADPLEPLHLLVFTPGIYSVSVDTRISQTPGASVLADTPLARTPVELQALPTEEFIDVVQEQVESFLTTHCAPQEVLMPSDCPFGLQVGHQLASTPKWSIAEQPRVTVVPDGPQWAIPPADAVARIEVDIRSIFDGSVTPVVEDVPFQVNGTVTVLPDETLSIRVGSPG